MRQKSPRIELPEDFYCSISGQIMIEPVMVIESGHSYEREMIIQWFQSSSKDPISGKQLNSIAFTENHTLRKIITRELERNPSLYHCDDVYFPTSLKTDFIAACTTGDLSTFQRLFAKHPGLLTLTLNQDGKQCLDLLLAAKSDALIAKYLIAIITQREEIDHIALLNKHEESALILFKLAILSDADESFTCLVALITAFGKNILNKADEQGLVCMHYAAQIDDPKKMQYLIEHGADVNGKENDNDDHELTPLQIACRNGHTSLVNILSDNENVDMEFNSALCGYKDIFGSIVDFLQDSESISAAHVAIYYGHLDCFKILYFKSSSLIADKNTNFNALEYATIGEQVACISWILENVTVSEIYEFDRDYVVKLAAKTGNIETLKKLYAHDIKPEKPELLFHYALSFNSEDNSPSHMAEKAVKDDKLLALYEYMATLGIDINDRNDDSAQALHLACEIDAPKTCELLIREGAELNTTDGNGLTPLLVAAKHNSMNACEVLLEHVDPKQTGKNGNTALHVMISPTIAELFLARGLDINIENDAGYTPLHRVFDRVHHDSFFPTVCFLIEQGADINAAPYDGRRPIELACQHKKIPVIERLLEENVDLNFTNRKQQNLLWSIDNIKVFKVLAQSGKLGYESKKLKEFINHQDTNGNTWIHEICNKYNYYRYQTLIELLLEQGADLSLYNKAGKQAIHCLMERSFSKDWQQFVKLITKFSNINACTQDDKKLTALHIVADQSNAANKIKFLLSLGADPQVKANKHGVLDYAVWSKSTDNIQALLDVGVSVNDQSTTGYTPLHWAAQKDDINMIRFLHSQKANLELRDAWGYTPLLRAARKGHTQACKTLIELNADISKTTNKEENIFHLFVLYEKIQSLREITVENEATLINKKNKKEQTPLHIAIEKNNAELVELLLDRNADSVIKSMNNKSVLHLLVSSTLPEALIKQIIELCKPIINDRDDKYFTPLLTAASKNRCDLIKPFIEAGADTSLTHPSKIGIANVHLDILFHLIDYTDRETSPETEHYQTIKWLLDCGHCSGNIRIAKSGNTARYPLLLHALHHGSITLAQLFVEQGQSIKAIDQIYSLLDIAVDSGVIPLCNYLIEQGVRTTPNTLCIAIKNRDMDMIHFLINYAVDLNCEGYYKPITIYTDTKDVSLNTPLYYAIDNRRDAAIELLLKSGADINKKSGGFTPLQHQLSCITMNGHRNRIFKILLTYNPDLSILSDDGDNFIQMLAKKGESRDLLAFREKEEIIFQHLDDIDAEGKKPIHLSIEANNHRMTKALLEFAPALLKQKTENKDALTPLHLAVMQNNTTMVKCILEFSSQYRGLNITIIRDGHGRCPLHLAQSQEIATLLIKHALNLGRKNMNPPTNKWELPYERGSAVKCTRASSYKEKDDQNNLPLHLCSIFEVATLLIEEHPEGVTAQNSDGQTPFIMLFTTQGFTEDKLKIADLLLSKMDKDMINTEDSNGFSALHHACKQGEVAAVQWLCEKNADVNLTTNNEDKLTPAHIAATLGDVECLKILFNHSADFNLFSGEPYKATPLGLAAAHKQISAFKYLLPLTKDPMRAAEGSSLWCMIAAGGSVELYQFLCQEKIGINQKDPNILGVALVCGHPDLCEILLNEIDSLDNELLESAAIGMRDSKIIERISHASCEIERKGHNQLTPIQGAALFKNSPMLKTLTQMGANINKIINTSSLILSDERDFAFIQEKIAMFNVTAFENIVKIMYDKFYVNTLGILCAHCIADLDQNDEIFDTITLLLVNNAKPVVYENKDQSVSLPLLNIIVKFTKCLPVIKLLVEYGEKLAPTLLIEACKIPQEEFGINENHILSLVNYLIDQGLDVNDLGPEGNTALHIAVANNHRRVAERLLDAGANYKLKNTEGRSAAKEAMHHGHDANYIYHKVHEIQSRNTQEVTALRAEVVSLRAEITRLSQHPNRFQLSTPVNTGAQAESLYEQIKLE